MSTIVNLPNHIGESRNLKKHNSSTNQWTPSEDNCIKISVNVSKNQYMRLSGIAYIMRDSRTNVVMTNCKRIGDSPILLAEREAIRQALVMRGWMNIPKARIYRDSQVAINVINDNISVSKEIITIVDNIKILLASTKKYNVYYYNRNTKGM